jgi:hypothetical protein
LSTTFIAEIPGSPPREEQLAAIGADDVAVDATKSSFSKLLVRVREFGIPLGQGDRVKVYDLSCVALSTPRLMSAMMRLLDAGISIEIVKPEIVITPAQDDRVRAFLAAMDATARHIHGIKTHPIDAKPQGRKRLIDEQTSRIKRLLAEPGATSTSVAKSLGIARSTLFNYLNRIDKPAGLNRRRGRRQ